MKSLMDSVTKLSGVGRKRQHSLARLGIKTIKDLVTYFPFRYADFKVRDLADVENQEKVTLKGQVVNTPVNFHYGYRRNRLSFRLLVDQNHLLWVTFFNRPWLKRRLHPGDQVLVYGRFDRYRASLVGIKLLSSGRHQLGAIYPAGKGLNQVTIKKLVRAAFLGYRDQIVDYLPVSIAKKYRLEPELTMIHDMHFPKTSVAAKLARRTAKFDEFFLFQMRLQVAKQTEHRHRGAQINYQGSAIHRFIQHLPYQLTPAQLKVINEIDYDLKRPIEMNRLLQGDVGSGKTVVAAIAAYATVTAGYQVALMAPTEILAEQHANGLTKAFRGFHVRIGLLTGNTKPAARKELLPRIAKGQIDLIIGTHALIQPEVKYHHLGLAIVDEQHRFGVNQRKALRKKGRRPNLLAMTATPIPRTLAITAYGEMDVSIIDQEPKGRKPVKTAWIRTKQVPQVMGFLKKILQQGEQIYVVAPLIESSDKLALADAKTVYTQFDKIFGNQFKVGLLDGRMKDEVKNQIMSRFKAGQIQILVSTTVIEVGVDVSNAALMMIYNADHFGLSQLHQLRGRVGRGSAQSYCLLVADPKSQSGRKRMQVMIDTNNGFVVSQKDLELRGPGDVLGRVQSGLPEFKVGDPVADLAIMNCAQQEAIQIVSESGWRQKYPKLVERLRMGPTTKVFD